MKRSLAKADRLAAGFTLLELLVAMTIVSLLAAAMLFSWRVAASSWGRSNEVLDQERRVTATLDLLNKQMAEMVPAAPWVATGNPALFFQGNPQTARFLSRYSLQGRAGSGPYLIEYHVTDADSDGVNNVANLGVDDTQQLLMNEIPVRTTDDLSPLLSGTDQGSGTLVLHFAPFQQREETRVLLQGAQQIRFEYYRPADTSEPGEWIQNWVTLNNELPRGMAIRITAKAEPERLAPVSVVAEVPSFTVRTK